MSCGLAISFAVRGMRHSLDFDFNSPAFVWAPEAWIGPILYRVRLKIKKLGLICERGLNTYGPLFVAFSRGLKRWFLGLGLPPGLDLLHVMFNLTN